MNPSESAPRPNAQETAPDLEKLIAAGVAAALEKIKERYENPADPDKQLAYHSLLHTPSVMSRAKQLLEAMGLSLKEQLLGLYAAAHHDGYQDDQEIRVRNGLRVRYRNYPSNEEKSADEAIEWLQQQGSNLLTPEDYELVRQGILITVPGHIEEGELKGALYQPGLNEYTHPVARAVALADLNASGMDGKKFSDEGDPLFREMNIEITQRLRSLSSRSELDAATQERYRQVVIAWREQQVRFAKQRQARLDEELKGLTEAQTKAVKALFTKFDEAIEECERIVEERKQMNFWEAAKATGYTVPDK